MSFLLHNRLTFPNILWIHPLLYKMDITTKIILLIFALFLWQLKGSRQLILSFPVVVYESVTLKCGWQLICTTCIILPIYIYYDMLIWFYPTYYDHPSQRSLIVFLVSECDASVIFWVLVVMFSPLVLAWSVNIMKLTVNLFGNSLLCKMILRLPHFPFSGNIIWLDIKKFIIGIYTILWNKSKFLTA